MKLIRIDIEGDHVGLPIRGQRYATKSSFRAIGREWSDKMLPDHFNRNKQRAYRFRQRTTAYLKRKRRDAMRGLVKGGGVTDLVHSGRLRESATGYNMVRAFPTRATVTINTPKYARINYRPGRPNLGQELTTVIASEARKLDVIGEDELDRATIQWQKQNPVRKRIT